MTETKAETRNMPDEPGASSNVKKEGVKKKEKKKPTYTMMVVRIRATEQALSDLSSDVSSETIT